MTAGSLFIFNFNGMILKRIILNIVLVVIVIFILDFTIGRTLRYFYFKQTSGFDSRTTYAIEKTKADLLIFGASSANHHYVPEVFEDSLKMSFYNTGRDGNGIFFQTALLRCILKRYTPKVIILDYRGDFGKGSTDYDRMSVLLPYYRTHKEIRDIVELRSPFERIKLLSEIYPFNSQLLTIAVGNLEMNRTRRPDNKGYVGLDREWKAKIDTAKNLPVHEVDSNKYNAFREFLSLAKKSGIKVFVIYSPVFLKFNRLQEIEICNDICTRENVPFWDFSNDTLFINNSHLFDDLSHLNHNGAMIFSDLVVGKMKHDLIKNIP